MPLTSLKQESDSIECWTENQYGYGTSISLSGEQCEALGITKAMSVGQGVTIKANGIVTRSTEELEAETDSGGKDVSISIQLTEISVTKSGGANPKKAAQMLYGDDDD